MSDLFKNLYVVLVFALFLPLFVFASSNDVTFNNGSQIDLTIPSGGTMTLFPTNADTVHSVSVGASTIGLTLSQNSTFTATTSTTRWLQATPATHVTSTDCTSTQSSIAISKTTSGDASLTISIGDSCGQVVTGGGGSEVVTAAPTPAPAPAVEEEVVEEAVPPAVVEEAPAAPAPTPVVIQVAFPKILEIKTTLEREMENDNVRALQEALASDSELYPEGLVTGYFGPLTERAVQRFQAKYGIVSSGTSDTTGYGLVGPKTRVKLQEVFGGATRAPDVTDEAKIAELKAKIIELQALLMQLLQQFADALQAQVNALQ